MDVRRDGGTQEEPPTKRDVHIDKVLSDIYLTCRASQAIPASKAKRFSLYMLLLVLKLRRGYLIDCFSATAEEILSVTQEVLAKCLGHLDYVPRLIVVKLGSDVLIIDEAHYLRIKKELEEGNVPVIIDISQVSPVLLPEEDAKSILLKTLSSSSSSSSGCIEILVPPHDVMRAFPPIVGLFLSYPVLYNYMSENDRIGNALSAEPLQRTSLRLRLCGFYEHETDIDIMEFSCPTAIIESNKHIEIRIQDFLVALQKEISRSIEDLGCEDIMSISYTVTILSLETPII